MNIADHIYSVTGLTREIKRLLETGISPLWLRGELTGVHLHRSGHLYLTLKDETAQISGVMWRTRVSGLEFRPEDGIDVLAFGRISLYEKAGRYQFDIEVMQPAGRGALALEFEKLKARLAADGLFDEERKRPIPLHPERIGVVTSASGAAVRDVLVTLSRRGFDLDVILAPAAVQGESASGEIAGALARLASLEPQPDLIIVTRGGGSIEDLWAFNEETTVRAVAACPVPVISGVGHETDTTLTDLAADLRAPTPTGAAERATPDRLELVRTVDSLKARLVRGLTTKVESMELRLENAAGAYGLKRVPDRLLQLGQQLDELQGRCERALAAGLERQRQRLESFDRRLFALSPKGVLRRGYAVVRRGRTVIRDASDLARGDKVKLLLSKGSADAEVTDVHS